MSSQKTFQAASVLHKLKHYLPSQAALKDFVHHNTLHAFEELDFFTALQTAHKVFGYQTTLRIDEYQALYAKGEIREEAIDFVVSRSPDNLIPVATRKEKLLNWRPEPRYVPPRIGRLRLVWKEQFHFDLETVVNHTLFKMVGSYLDQGISSLEFRSASRGFLSAVRTINNNSFFPLFRSKRVTDLLNDEQVSIGQLLKVVVGDERYFEQYLFDQQFAHPGWSGFVAVCEQQPEMLFDERIISLEEFIIFELLLEIDALDNKLGREKWRPLAEVVDSSPIDLFAPAKITEAWLLRRWWQEALELSYYDQVLRGLSGSIRTQGERGERSPKFQAFFCIDDREESIRRWIEQVEPAGQTFGTPAHYNLLIKYRPRGGKFNAHVCPGPATPRHIILDTEGSEPVGEDLGYHKSSSGLLSGVLHSNTIGIWSAVKLFFNLFKPSAGPGHSSAFEHMSHKAEPAYENQEDKTFDGYREGYTVAEMIELVQDEFTRTGLTRSFAPIVYFFGHGGSSTNNPYYAGYNCGACSGRPSSLNARVLARMANREDVRKGLQLAGIDVPDGTWFVGGLHDTTRDEFVYYDVDKLPLGLIELHVALTRSFKKALSLNAKERARQFLNVDTNRAAEAVHTDVKLRSYALFEPRPELNHSNNCLCIVGRRQTSRSLFLDQRAFLNSYDYQSDPDGMHLAKILGAATPVCGGINLEYYFSRVDNERLGAGSKLPHNVTGLYGLTNGVEGDLRTGLPSQMIDVHVPLRLMMIVEQAPETVFKVLDENPATKNWYDKEWMKLAVVDPASGATYLYQRGVFAPYQFNEGELPVLAQPERLAETLVDNSPVYKLA